jgi:biotin synthase-like enzyme
LERIIELEVFFKKTLHEDEIKQNEALKQQLNDSGWLPFKHAFQLQNIFKEEKVFFQALSFIKSIEICQQVSKFHQPTNQAENLLMKLKLPCTPKLNFVIIG